jgi:hypothetical protein
MSSNAALLIDADSAWKMTTLCTICVFGAAAADVEGALQILQWAASTKPEPSAAEQQLKEAWQKVGALLCSCIWANSCWRATIGTVSDCCACVAACASANQELCCTVSFSRLHPASSLLPVAWLLCPSFPPHPPRTPPGPFPHTHTQVDSQPNGPSKGVPLALVGRISWWAAVLGCQQLAEQCAARAATSQVRWPVTEQPAAGSPLLCQLAALLGAVLCAAALGSELNPSTGHCCE